MNNSASLNSQEKLVNELAQAEVMFVGRSLFPEYVKMFNLDLESLRGEEILDVASGPASFTCEMRHLGYAVTALDIMYSRNVNELKAIAYKSLEDFNRDLPEDVFQSQAGDIAWLDEDPLEEINTPKKILAVRKESLQLFLEDFEKEDQRETKHYLAGSLPEAKALDCMSFDLILAGNLLFAYSKKQEFGYDFHYSSILSLASRLKPTGEIRIFPYGDEKHFDFPFKKLRADLQKAGINSKTVESSYRFVKGWTQLLVLWNDAEPTT